MDRLKFSCDDKRFRAIDSDTPIMDYPLYCLLLRDGSSLIPMVRLYGPSAAAVALLIVAIACVSIVWLQLSLDSRYSSCKEESPRDPSSMDPTIRSPVHKDEKKRAPNIVLMLLDDHGYGDMGAYDSSVDETPHMDALAASGIRFTDFHSAASLCTPSRAALLTGRLGMRTGVTTNFGTVSLGGLPIEELTMAELLPASFRKHMVGKWHLGHHEPFHPSFRGFDTVYGLPYSGTLDSGLF